MEIIHHILVFSTVGYTYFITDTDHLGNETYTDTYSHYYKNNVSKWFLHKCEINKQADIMDSLEEEVEKALNCTKRYANFKSLENDWMNAVRNDSMFPFFQKYCKVWNPVYDCFDNTTSVIKRCLDENEKHQLDVALNVTEYMLDYMCANDANVFRKLFTGNDSQIIEKKWNNIKLCVETQDIIPPILRNGSCADFEEIRNCIHKEMSELETSGATKAIDDLLIDVEKRLCNSTICKDCDPSSVSRYSVEAVLLITLLFFTAYL